MCQLRALLLIVLINLGGVHPALAERVVLMLGDSLTAGLGVSTEEAYPSILGQMLTADGITDVRLINAGVSGSTTASALSRLTWYDRIKPDILFLALGANDGLRGLSLAEMADNLAATIKAAQAKGMRVLLVGMELPPNYGDQYTAGFRRVYLDLAARFHIPLIPFLLEGVGGVAALNQADGLHPNAEGHRRIAQHVYPALRQMLGVPLAGSRSLP